MSSPPAKGSPQADFGFDRAAAARFARYTGGFWRGNSARAAWTLTLGLAGVLMLKLIVDVATNRWNRWFFDALENRDATSAGYAALAFVVLVGAVAAGGVGIVLARERLQVRWREWCTHNLLDGWLKNQRFYRMTAADSPMPNPEYRISDDVRMATEPLTDFAIGLFTAVLASATFASILWSVGGSLTLPFGEGQITIPAFMLLGAIVYGVCMSGLIPIVGRKLAGAAARKNEEEAKFRFEMIRLRENSEGVIMARGEADARERLSTTYSGLVRAWLQVVRQHGAVTWVMNANSAMVPVVPLMLCAPKYLQGQLSLGEVMQLASAFIQVQVAISWLVDNYRAIAEWFASARRITELVDAFEAIDESTAANQELITRGDSADDVLRIEELRLCDQSGRVIVAHAEVAIRQGEKAMLAGDAGAGKSVLVRAIAGLWPWGAGRILAPPDRTLCFMPATPFLPAGPLRETLTYPSPPDGLMDVDLRVALHACGLERFTDKLDDASRWDQTLSASERQRLAFARLLVQKPDIIVLEDALSVFEGATQEELFATLVAANPAATIIVVGGRASLSFHFDRTLSLQLNGEGSVLVETPSNERPALAIVGA
jgi:putative ATP-binding cassette transporter